MLRALALRSLPALEAIGKSDLSRKRLKTASQGVDSTAAMAVYATVESNGRVCGDVERIQGRAYKVTSLALIRSESGQPLSYLALWNRFEEARKRAANTVDAAGNGEAAVAVRGFQFRDLRAKAGTDKADSTDLRGAQQQLGHRSVKTTEVYLRARGGR